jgi:glycosyltransferase involved in cell wall biosynthesis
LAGAFCYRSRDIICNTLASSLVTGRLQYDVSCVHPLRVLVLASSPPFPLTDGARIAIFEPLRRLASRGHVIDLLSFGAADDPGLPALRACCGEVVLVDERPLARLWARRAWSPVRRVPYLASLFWSPALAAEMRRLLAARAYDVVQVEALSMAAYVPIARAHGVPVVLRTQNVESALCARQAELARGLRRWHYRLQWPKLVAYEGARCAEADLCIALTAADAGRLSALTSPPARIAIVPAGVDLDTFTPAAAARRTVRSPSVLLTGTMNYPPNADAALWFLDTIWPSVLRAVPDATFTIVGKHPSRELRRRADGERVIVTGLVDDVRPWIERAAVCVAPLRVGGGMRIKILQAMAMGKAIVSTSLGAEGIDVEDGREAFLADSPELFGRRIVDLLQDASLCDAVGAAARRRAERQYNWEPLIDRLEAHYRALAGQIPAAAAQADSAGSIERVERTA